VRANPAGAMGRNLEAQFTFKVCPPETGVAEIGRKRIELKQALLKLMSAKTTDALEDPLRIEKLQRQVQLLVNKEILKKAKVQEVYVTGFEVK
jgi:flagellar basal body-associated protein FliL